MNFERYCPLCSRKISYKHKSSLVSAEKSKSLCNSCAVSNRPKKLIVFERKCPLCETTIITHKTRKAFREAKKRNSSCVPCANERQRIKAKEARRNREIIIYTRTCAECKCTLTYKTRTTFLAAEEKKSLCKSCGIKNRFKKRPGQNAGKENPFYGKVHSNETKEKIKAAITGRILGKDPRKGSPGTTNPMHGKSFYAVWEEKYGKEAANILLKQYRDKISTRVSGRGNPMYGKPAPQGSGNGWKGWFKGWFFRSLRELSYAVMLEKQKKKWVGAEKHRISYTDPLGVKRTYCPDFLVENKILVEIKPDKLIQTPSVMAKSKAGKDYCEKQGLTYHITDISLLPLEELVAMYKKEEITFTKRYEEKFKVWFSKKLCQ